MVYFLVSNPVRYKYSLTRTSNESYQKILVKRTPTNIILILIWFVSVLLWIPIILFLKKKDSNQNIDYLNSTHRDNKMFLECDIQAVPQIIIPHSLIVYHMPIILIIIFYSRTINILNNKIKTRSRFSSMRNKSLPKKNENLIELTEIKKLNETNKEPLNQALIKPSIKRSSLRLPAVKLLNQMNSRSNSFSIITNLENDTNFLETPKTNSSYITKFKNNTNKQDEDKSSLFSNSINKTQIKRELQEKRITIRVGLILVCFIISWTPFSIFWPLTSICEVCIPANIYLFSFWLAYINSFITPFLLLISNSKYQEFMNVFFKKNSNI